MALTIGSIARAALFAPLLTLGCMKHPDRINLGLRRRLWTVEFGLDSGRVTDVTARFIYQDLE